MLALLAFLGMAALATQETPNAPPPFLPKPGTTTTLFSRVEIVPADSKDKRPIVAETRKKIGYLEPFSDRGRLLHPSKISVDVLITSPDGKQKKEHADQYSYFVVDDGGLTQVAQQKKIGKLREPEALSQPRVVLPANPQVGQEWDSRGEKDAQIHSRVSAVGVEAETPYGVIKNCLLIERATRLEPPLVGTATVKSRDWYSDFGLVRSTVDEIRYDKEAGSFRQKLREAFEPLLRVDLRLVEVN